MGIKYLICYVAYNLYFGYESLLTLKMNAQLGYHFCIWARADSIIGRLSRRQWPWNS